VGERLKCDWPTRSSSLLLLSVSVSRENKVTRDSCKALVPSGRPVSQGKLLNALKVVGRTTIAFAIEDVGRLSDCMLILG
jgi:hypothetical protein